MRITTKTLTPGTCISRFQTGAERIAVNVVAVHGLVLVDISHITLLAPHVLRAS